MTTGESPAGAAASHGIVLRSAHTVERHAQVERIARAPEAVCQKGDERLVEQDAVGDDGERRCCEREVDETPDLRMEQRLTAGEVDLPHPEGGAFGERALHLLHAHHRDLVGLWTTGDEAVAAGDVAEGAGDLQPEGVEPTEPDRRAHWSARAAQRHQRRSGHRSSAVATAKYPAETSLLRRRKASTNTPRP